MSQALLDRGQLTKLADAVALYGTKGIPFVAIVEMLRQWGFNARTRRAVSDLYDRSVVALRKRRSAE